MDLREIGSAEYANVRRSASPCTDNDVLDSVTIDVASGDSNTTLECSVES